MTELPSQPMPGIYQGGKALDRTRPGIVTAAAVVGLVIGSLSLICDVFSVVMTVARHVMSDPGTAPPPGWMTTSSLVMQLITFIFATAWIIGSVNLLRVAPWSRRFALRLAKVNLLYIAASLVFGFAIAPQTKAAMEQQMAANTNRDSQSVNMGKGFSTAMAYGGPVIGAVVGSILPGLMLIFLSQSNAIAAFKELEKSDTPELPLYPR